MLSGAVKFFLTILIANWLWAEVVAFAPQVGTLYTRVTEACAIPTHDKWSSTVNVHSTGNGASGITGFFKEMEKQGQRELAGLMKSGSGVSMAGAKKSLFELFDVSKKDDVVRRPRFSLGEEF